MPVSPETQERGKQILRDEIKRQNAHASETQINEAFDKLIASERIKSALEYGSDVWPVVPAHVSALVRDGLATHDGIKPIPSAADVARHLLAERVAVFGEHMRGQLAIELFREAERMSDAERIATGAPVGAAIDPSETPDTAKPLHARGYDWAGWDFEVSKRTGTHVANVLPSKRREIIDALKAESRKAANGGMHDADIAERARIEAKASEKRTPSEKITLARLGG